MISAKPNTVASERNERSVYEILCLIVCGEVVKDVLSGEITLASQVS